MYTHKHCFVIKKPLCYWFPKLPLSFHLVLRFVRVPVPVALSPKPLEVLLAGRSMAYIPRRTKRGADCGCSVSHLFLPLMDFCTSLSGWRLDCPLNTQHKHRVYYRYIFRSFSNSYSLLCNYNASSTTFVPLSVLVIAGNLCLQLS